MTVSKGGAKVAKPGIDTDRPAEPAGAELSTEQVRPAWRRPVVQRLGPIRVVTRVSF
jgi:hypothetical protein